MSEHSLWINTDGEVVHPNAPEGIGGRGRFRTAGTLSNTSDHFDEVPHPFSPVGRTQPLDDDHLEHLQEGGKTTAGGDTEETPTFKPTSPVPATITADTVEEFIAKSNAAMGDGGSVGHMQPTVTYDLELDGKGKVVKVNMVVETSIVRPRWGGGRVKDDKAKELIKKAETLIKGHEERHRDIAQDMMTKACRAMKGKTGTKAEETYKEFEKKMNEAQAALDAKEGGLYVEHNGPAGKAGPATDVKLGPAPKSSP